MRALKEISIPYETRSGQKKELLLDSKENINCFVSGCDGSGKTAFLMAIAGSVIKKYGDNTVNVWCVGFKRDEFSELASSNNAIKPLTANSDEEIKDIIYKIYDEILRREKLCKEHHISSYVCDDDGTIGPRLLILIDDYFLLDKVICSDSNLKSIFESILRIGCAVGISFILADRTPLSYCQGISHAVKAMIPVGIDLND